MAPGPEAIDDVANHIDCERRHHRQKGGAGAVIVVGIIGGQLRLAPIGAFACMMIADECGQRVGRGAPALDVLREVYGIAVHKGSPSPPDAAWIAICDYRKFIVKV